MSVVNATHFQKDNVEGSEGSFLKDGAETFFAVPARRSAGSEV
jgi:hypothetical protein